MSETPSPTRAAAPQARRMARRMARRAERWVLQAWIVAVGVALLWALLG